jgi:hypothetical protein
LRQIKIADRSRRKQTQLPCDFRHALNKSLRSGRSKRNGAHERMACMHDRQSGGRGPVDAFRRQGLTYFISRFGPTSAP